MTIMGAYCKAYLLRELRAFPEWHEAQVANADVDDHLAPQGGAAPLTDDSVVYVHENLIVTAGIYMDEDVVFDSVTPAWQAYCREALQFAVPPGLADTPLSTEQGA